MRQSVPHHAVTCRATAALDRAIGVNEANDDPCYPPDGWHRVFLAVRVNG